MHALTKYTHSATLTNYTHSANACINKLLHSANKTKVPYWPFSLFLRSASSFGPWFAWFQHLLYVLLHMQQFAFCCVHLMHYQQTFTYSVNVLIQDWLYKKCNTLHNVMQHQTSTIIMYTIKWEIKHGQFVLLLGCIIHCRQLLNCDDLWQPENMQHTTSTISESYIAHNIV